MTLEPHDLTKEQREWINEARNLIDFLEAKPDLIPAYLGVAVYPDVFGKDSLANKLRLLGASEKHDSDTLIGARRKFGPHCVDVTEFRSVVCERVQVGTETIEVTVPADEIPDGAEVIGLHSHSVARIRQEVPKYEVKCPPLLAGAS